MSEIEIKSLDSSYIDECLDLVWQVFSEFETPVFPPEGSVEYKRIIEETREKRNIKFYGALDEGKVVGVLGMREIGMFYIEDNEKAVSGASPFYCLRAMGAL